MEPAPCTAGALQRCACSGSHFESIHFLDLHHYFPNELKVDLLGPSYHLMIIVSIPC